jgi:integrase
MPFLLNTNGIPLFDPTVFMLTELRTKNLAAKSIENALRSLLVFHIFLDRQGVDLKQRLISGKLLEAGEIAALARDCRKPVSALRSTAEVPSPRHINTHILSIERFRASPHVGGTTQINTSSAATRLRHIRAYLSWMGHTQLLLDKTPPTLRDGLGATLKTVEELIDAHMPKDHRTRSPKRQGLLGKVVLRICEIMDPSNPLNPWEDEHCQHRNRLILDWLLVLGLRRGELLGIRIRDISFTANTIIIPRRADDDNDPRKDQPNAKTLARILCVIPDLIERTDIYILKHRSQIEGARKHDFLFVASDSGMPLSSQAVNKLFSVLRNKFPELPQSVMPHVWRHTWNDLFSKQMKANNIPQAMQEKIRAYLMGWSPTSKTASTYNDQFIKAEALAASLKLQQRLFEDH